RSMEKVGVWLPSVLKNWEKNLDGAGRRADNGAVPVLAPGPAVIASGGVIVSCAAKWFAAQGCTIPGLGATRSCFDDCATARRTDCTCCSASSILPRRAPRVTEGCEARGTM